MPWRTGRRPPSSELGATNAGFFDGHFFGGTKFGGRRPARNGIKNKPKGAY